jgi:hypothetical protein
MRRIPFERLYRGGAANILIPPANAKRKNTMPAETALVLLAPRQLHNIPDASGVTVACRSGSVWITVDNDPNDYVLEAGETFVTPEHERALVYALTTARIDVVVERQSRNETMPTFKRFHAMPLTNAAR